MYYAQTAKQPSHHQAFFSTLTGISLPFIIYFMLHGNIRLFVQHFLLLFLFWNKNTVHFHHFPPQHGPTMQYTTCRAISNYSKDLAEEEQLKASRSGCGLMHKGHRSISNSSKDLAEHDPMLGPSCLGHKHLKQSAMLDLQVIPNKCLINDLNVC